MFRKFRSFISVVILTSCAFSLAVTGKDEAQTDTKGAPDAPQQVQKDYGKMPLLFEENKGQTDAAAKFVARASGFQLYLTKTGAVFNLKHAVVETSGPDDETISAKHETVKTKSDRLTMGFAGANANPAISGSREAITKTNFYKGKKRLENIPNYRAVSYKNLYDGIDAVFYSNADKQLEYDFVVSPNTDADQIKLNFEGAKDISIRENGDMVLKTDNTELVQQRPIAYQEINGQRREVEVGYKLTENQITFALGGYDESQPLTIDPVLNYLTYIGGTAFDDVFEIAADNAGNAYISGDTSSLNFHGESRASNDGSAAYVAKINAQGTDFVYLTILEGNNDDLGSGLTLDSNNNVYVVGQATSDFPVTQNAFDTNLSAQGDGFAAKLDANGELIYATYIGGNAGDDLAFDVAVDSAGKAYVVGQTLSGLSFPQKNRYQGCGAGVTFNSYDAYLTVINSSGTDITYSTCIGGNVTVDHAFSVALDSSNNAYLTGLTNGGNFPTKNAFQPNSGGGTDAFVAKFNPALSGEASLIYSTYLGGVGTDRGSGIAVNSNNQAVVGGITGSTNFPLAIAFDTTNQINEGFVTVIGSGGNTLVSSSFLGGADQDQVFNVALGNGGLIYVTGHTLSNDFPMARPFQATRRGLRDAFVTKLKFGVGIISSSYLGGNGNDLGSGIVAKGNFIYVGGNTASNNLATTTGVLKPTFGGGETDGFVAKILDTRLDSVGVFRPAAHATISSPTITLTQSITNVVGQNATFTSALAGTRGVAGDWDGDGVDTIGSFTNGAWKVRNVNFPAVNPGAIPSNFGQAGDLPVVGDWDGDGIDTIAVFRPSAGQFFATNSLVLVLNPPVNFTVTFGQNGDLPVAGDWNGDGIDTMGVYRPATGQFFLTDTNEFNASIDLTAFFGVAEDLPFAGDFNGDGIDTISVWRPSVATFFITNDNTSLATAFPFGQAGSQPIAGDWDGRPLP